MTRFRNIRWTITAAFGVVALVAGGLISEGGYAEFGAAKQATLAEARSVAESIAFAASYVSTNDPAALQAFVRGLHELHQRDIAIVDRHKIVLADAVPEEVGVPFNGDPLNEVSATIADGIPRSFVEVGVGGPGELRQLVIPLRSNQADRDSPIYGAVIVQYSQQQDASFNRAQSRLRQDFGIGLAIALFAIFVGIRISARISGPLTALAVNARAIANGRYDVTIDVSSQDEIGQLAEAFNTMARRLSHNAERVESLQRLRDERSAMNLNESEQRYRQLVELSPDAICIVRHGRVTFANQACASLLAVPSPSELMGRPVTSFLTEDSVKLVRQLHPTVMVHRSPSGLFQTSVRRLDGATVDVEGSAGPFVQAGVYSTQIVVRDISERKKASERLEYLAQYDALTGLPNRTLFRDRLRHAVSRARRQRTHVAVMFLDLDRFKEINDSLGHGAGDIVLTEVAHRFNEALREADTIARLGGDEFTVVLDDVVGVEQANMVAERVLHTLRRPIHVGGRDIHITTSIGIAMFPENGDEAEDLIQAADIAMYRAKESGRNTFAYFDSDMAIEAKERLNITALMRKALDQQEFSVHYQPKVTIGGSQISGVEALIRWNSPELGQVAPAKFIPLAEESGLIVPIGAWVLETACRQAAAWLAQGLQPLAVAVNLSAFQFKHHDLVATVTHALQSTRLPPHLLELEITETMLMADPERTTGILRQLRALGVQLSIDDFGTGYSSLAYLKRFPVQALKIDRSFIRDLASDPDDASIVNAVVAMAKSLQLKVIAEGVETEEQLAYLSNLNCDEYQGYLFSHPVPADVLAAQLRRFALGTSVGLSGSVSEPASNPA